MVSREGLPDGLVGLSYTSGCNSRNIRIYLKVKVKRICRVSMVGTSVRWPTTLSLVLLASPFVFSSFFFMGKVLLVPHIVSVALMHVCKGTLAEVFYGHCMLNATLNLPVSRAKHIFSKCEDLRVLKMVWKSNLVWRSLARQS